MKKLLLVALSAVSFSAFARPEYVVQPGELVEADALCVPVERCTSRSSCATGCGWACSGLARRRTRIRRRTPG